VELAYPNRVYWPELGLTKRDLADYYASIAPVLLPHVRDRPLTIKQHYTVPRGPFRWIKDAPPELPEWFRVSQQPAKSRGGDLVRYALADDVRGLLWLVDFGVVDLHVWPSRIDTPDRPDFVVFDLDPAGVGFGDVVGAALLLHNLLTALELESLPMTTGGKGVHVRVPIARQHTHEETRRFADIVASAARNAAPHLVTTERQRNRRHGVYVDTKMNGHGQQLVAPYSVRPLAGAPVATPLRWEELDDTLDPAAFTPHVMLRRVGERGDLFAPLLAGEQDLAAALARA
jgi:bifunctional non-homologous end joining protein LigD